MSSREEAPFEALTGRAEPYEGFGAPLTGHEVEDLFSQVLGQAASRLREVYQLEIRNGRDDVVQLEAVVVEMWREGWEPGSGDVNLFTRDFGAVLTNAVRHGLGGVLVLRSSTDASHASVWWPSIQLEAFPFHKAYKRLTDRGEAPLLAFWDGLSEALRRAH